MLRPQPDVDAHVQAVVDKDGAEAEAEHVGDPLRPRRLVAVDGDRDPDAERRVPAAEHVRAVVRARVPGGGGGGWWVVCVRWVGPIMTTSPSS